jgi:hypothetical protein
MGLAAPAAALCITVAPGAQTEDTSRTRGGRCAEAVETGRVFRAAVVPHGLGQQLVGHYREAGSIAPAPVS